VQFLALLAGEPEAEVFATADTRGTRASYGRAREHLHA
jgi:hypothetical protein